MSVPQEMRRSAVVIAGMHRSGTSAVARLLSVFGLELPRTALGPRPSNELGHWGESDVLRALNDELLAAAGSAWDDVSIFPSSWVRSTQARELRGRVVEALADEYPGTGSFVFKDPRVCRIIPFWLGVLDDFGVSSSFVLPIRNPLEVAASLAARNGFPDDKGLLLWLRHVLDAEGDTRGFPRALVTYDALMRDRRGTAEAIVEALGLERSVACEASADELARLLPESQQHHAFAPDQLLASEEVMGWVKDAYSLLAAAADAAETPDTTQLDELRAALDEADLAYSPLLAAARHEARDLSEQLAAERARLETAIESREAEVADARRERDALRVEAAALRRDSRLQREVIADLRSRPAVRAWRAIRGRAARGRRTVGQLGSWVLRPGGDASPRTVWEYAALRTSGLFDFDFYLRRNPDVAASGMDPLMHYLEHGARAGLDPSRTFSTSAYFAQRPGLVGTGVNPLYDYWRRAGGSGRDRARGALAHALRHRPPQHGHGRTNGPPVADGDAGDRPYTMLGDYLAYATVEPLIETPFAEADRRVIGAMDSRRRQLAAEYAARSKGPLVSVIMPTYDRLPTLRNAIASVQAQTYGSWELIVIDDGSEDGTSEYVAGIGDERVRLVTRPTNRGVSAARNAGLAQVRGELIAYLDSDNGWHPDFLTIMAGYLADRPESDVAYCAQEVWDGTDAGPAGRELEAIRFGPFNRALLENRNYIDLNALVHTAAILERSGPFDESLPRLVDWELLLRYTVEKPALAVPCVLSRYERGGAPGQLSDTADWWDVFDRMLEIVRTPRLDLLIPRGETRAASWGAHPLHRLVGRTDYRRAVAIVIPSFEAEEYLRACIESVLAFTDGDFRLIVVDNGSGAGVRRYLRSLAERDVAEIIQNDENLGFTEAANRGIEAAGSDRDVILLNNDALATPGWIPGMWEVFDHLDDVGLVVPRQTLFPGTATTGIHVPYSRPDREVDVSLSAHHANVADPLLDERRGYIELRFGTFFCAYIPRETLDAVGSLNVEHGPHYRSDRVYCDMIREFAGRRIVYTPHSKLYHFLQRSTRELQTAEPAVFEDMFVRNDWQSVATRGEARWA